MALYRAQVYIEDDPASFSASVLVVADNEKQAATIAKKAAKNSYWEQAGGWGIASQTKVVDFSIAEAELPKHGVVMVSGHYDR